MYNIVIATDLKPETENALLRAVRLAQEHGARLHIIHAAHKSLIPNFEEQDEERCRTEIQALIEKYPSWEDIDFKVHILRGGRIHEQINTFAREIGADLVVMGADRSTAHAPDFVRTKVENVLWLGSYPVLAAFRDATSAYENILVVGKQYTAGLLDLIDKKRQKKNKQKLIKRVQKVLEQFEEISDCSGYDYIRDTPTLDILSEIKSTACELVVLEVSFADPLKPDLGEEVHNIVTNEYCDVLLIKRA